MQNNEEALQEMCDKLNAWIDEQSDPSLYKRWYYGDGRPYPTFDPITVTVTFKAGDHGNFGKDDADQPITETSEEVEPGTDWDSSWVPTTVADTGYTFTGWDPTPFPDTVDENLTFTAQWEAIKYNITYDYASGTAPTTDNPATYTVADNVNIANEPTRAGYTFTGWTSTDMSTPITTPTKPVTWSAGAETGDRSFTANWTANTDTAYKVEFYYQENGEYPTTADDSADRTGTTDTTASVTDDDKTPTEDGYVLDESKADDWEGTIAGDGSLVLKVYFKEQFTVKYAPGEQGTWDVADATVENLDYNAGTPDSPKDPTAEANHNPGYTFDGWNPEKAAKVTADATYTAKWKPNTDTAYKVEFYYQVDGEYPTTADDSADRTGTTDTTASVTDDDKTPTEDGYVLDESKADDWEGTIAGDGSLVLKVYFKQQFTVIYDPGDHGTWDADDETYEGNDYGADRPAFTVDPTADDAHDAGYSFGGWTPTLADTVTKDVTYTANWSANTDTKYTVQYFYQENGSYKDEPDSSVERSGTTDTTAEVTDADKESSKDNWVFDENAANVLSGTIAGDGSLVLKVYFKEQFSVKYAPGEHGTWDEETHANLDYNATTPPSDVDVEADSAHDAGYYFTEWAPEWADKVTGDITYTAQWEKCSPAKHDPPVKKTVTGDTPSTTDTFTFQLKAIETTADVEVMPMPEGSDGDTKTVDVKAGEEYEFGVIEFPEVGTYTYEITELDTGLANYTYDTSVYQVVYTVTQNGSELVAERSFTKDGQEVQIATFEFTNTYTAPEEPADDPSEDTPADKPASDDKPADNVIPDTGDEFPFGLLAVLVLAAFGLRTVRNRI